MYITLNLFIWCILRITLALRPAAFLRYAAVSTPLFDLCITFLSAHVYRCKYSKFRKRTCRLIPVEAKYCLRV